MGIAYSGRWLRAIVSAIGLVWLILSLLGNLSGSQVVGREATPADVDLVLTATVSAQTVTLGIPISYVVNIRNLGPRNADLTVFSQTVEGPPAPFNFQSNRGGVSCVSSDGTISCRFGRVSTTARITTSLHVLPTMTGIYSFTTLVTSAITDSNPLNNWHSVRVTVIDVPVADLIAVSSSPTDLGQSTYFSATLGSGTNVSYTWQMGDNVGIRTGKFVNYRYPASGTYRVTVTARNSRNETSAFLDIIVQSSANSSKNLYLPSLAR